MSEEMIREEPSDEEAKKSRDALASSSLGSSPAGLPLGTGILTIGDRSIPLQNVRISVHLGRTPALDPESVRSCEPPAMEGRRVGDQPSAVIRMAFNPFAFYQFPMEALGGQHSLAERLRGLLKKTPPIPDQATGGEPDYWDDFKMRVVRVGDCILVARRSGGHVVELTDLQRTEDARRRIEGLLKQPTGERLKQRLELFRMLDEWAALDDISCRRFNHPEPLADELYDVLMARRDRVLVQYRERGRG